MKKDQKNGEKTETLLDKVKTGTQPSISSNEATENAVPIKHSFNSDKFERRTEK